jgi:hypothetical protein
MLAHPDPGMSPLSFVPEQPEPKTTMKQNGNAELPLFPIAIELQRFPHTSLPSLQESAKKKKKSTQERNLRPPTNPNPKTK